MNFSLYIAKRYLYSKSSNNAINIITYIALIGVILGAASLFVVLSGFAGLKDFTLKFTSIIDPDLKAESTTGKSFMLTEQDLTKLKNIKEIKHFARVIEDRVAISVEDKNTLATLKGVDANYEQVAKIDSILDYGNWLDQKSNQVVMGWGISNTLSLGVLDFTKPISIYVPKAGTGQITSTKNAFNSVKAINVGVFYINETLNDEFVFAPIDLVKNLLNYKENQISSIEFILNENTDEALVKSKIKTILGNRVILKNRAQLNDALYKMLNTENLAVYLIFTLVLIIAFFNIIGSLIMMILDKKKSLNTLFNIGATLKDIRKIFFLQGSLMSVIGGIIGLFLAFILTLLQQQFNLVMITPTLPYPVSIKLENFIIVFITISILGIIASKIASTRITEPLVHNI
ncbi:ABC transporter permease [Neotamlana laminarinivorans]|uniref:FtsX-like permease family protein n=1 Tax=Neotamlana laminarinivorans TaxID=2883124 RepID=A0A9X1I132_9FLAO|nr:FtsX-like permease family protein [Tamlana laminarinivorans]MCB4798242.1 FtsX-like permease family protein [Tamlana laminarinivorans]